MDEEYYESEEWQEERNQVLTERGGQCERCGCWPESPHVHHVYGLASDVYEVLCPDCHADHHGNDELREYRRQEPHCKYCYKSIEWRKTSWGSWYPGEPGSDRRHDCRKS